VLGFKEGTGNLRRGRDLDRHVWAGDGERSWMVGGTVLVVRRIRVLLDAWSRLRLDEQERVIGRHRDSGAPSDAIASSIRCRWRPARRMAR
jgi:deferrochelatase/peroxidase EfeB